MDSRIVSATTRAAEQFKIPPHHALAFVEVESNGTPFARVGDTDLALIRWEGHYLWRRLPKHLRSEAREQGLAHPSAGGIKNPRSQVDRHALLNKAHEFCVQNGVDGDLAFECVSIGLGQVMGSHWRALGYESAEQMLMQAHDEYFDADVEDQIEMIFKYLEVNDLIGDAQRGSWRSLARGYNGPAYEKHNYHGRMRDAAARWARRLNVSDSGEPQDRLPTVRRNSRSRSLVMLIQQRLSDAGYHLGAIDGDFGGKTFSAVVQFQEDNGLDADGVVGPGTWTALDNAAPRVQPVSRAQATTADLRDSGSRTIGWLDRLQGLGVTVGGAGALTQASSVEGVLDEADRFGALASRVSEMLSDNVGLVLLVVAIAVVAVPHVLKRIRVEDHRAGKHVGR